MTKVASELTKNYNSFTLTDFSLKKKKRKKLSSKL